MGLDPGAPARRPWPERLSGSLPKKKQARKGITKTAKAKPKGRPKGKAKAKARVAPDNPSDDSPSEADSPSDAEIASGSETGER